ncbi:MAG: amidohydrolase family protein [Verrucomicrobiota bacterium]|nr:amidohydrolase family protein [Verrucomicrobiota bacterium]
MTIPSRRHFLGTAAAAALAGCCTMTAPRKTGAIDAHVHVWTRDTDRYPLKPGAKKADVMKPPSFTPDELMAHARPQGVDRVVLIQMSFYGHDNTYMLDTIAAAPKTYVGVALVDETAADLPAHLKALRARGVRGIRITPGRQSAGPWLESKTMARLWQEATDAGLAICPLINAIALPALHQMCKRFPRTTVVIDHFARIGVYGKVMDSDVDDLCRLEKFPGVHVKTSAFYALGKKQLPYDDLAPMILRLVEIYGPERLMWASDCPFQVNAPHTYAASIDVIRSRVQLLKPADRDWLLRGTAEKVFFA